MCDKNNLFCYICGLYTDLQHRVVVNGNQKLITLFEQYFSRSFILDKWYVPEICCSTCFATLKMWENELYGSRALPFKEPVTWHSLRIHRETNCYFCLTNTKGYHFKIRNSIKYAEVDSVSKTVLREKNDAIPNPTKYVSPIHSNEPSTTGTPSGSGTGSEYLPSGVKSNRRHYVSQEEFEDLVRDLELNKRLIEMLGSRMQQWDFLKEDVNITFARTDITSAFEALFSLDTDENNMAYCNDVDALFRNLNTNHNPDDWRLFIDGSTKSKTKIALLTQYNIFLIFSFLLFLGLKAVLLHNNNLFPSVPLVYATKIKETYNSMTKILEITQYNTHDWKIVSDFKVLTILNGMQGGNTKYPCTMLHM